MHSLHFPTFLGAGMMEGWGGSWRGHKRCHDASKLQGRDANHFQHLIDHLMAFRWIIPVPCCAIAIDNDT